LKRWTSLSEKPEEELVGDWQLYKTPITSAIPYFYRWKINQLKLMLADITTLEEKYEVMWAKVLRINVQAEAERLCQQLAESIEHKRLLREKYEQKKKTVQP
jgi:hypothetical protein